MHNICQLFDTMVDPVIYFQATGTRKHQHPLVTRHAPAHRLLDTALFDFVTLLNFTLTMQPIQPSTMAKAKPSSSSSASIANASVVGQQTPSLYMALAALQSALWFFVLPSICKPHWETLFSPFPLPIAEVLLWFAIVPYFLLYSTVVALPPYLLNWSFFEQFKISKEPWPWHDERVEVRKAFWRLTRRSMLLDFVGMCIFLPGMAYTSKCCIVLLCIVLMCL